LSYNQIVQGTRVRFADEIIFYYILYIFWPKTKLSWFLSKSFIIFYKSKKYVNW